MRPVIGITPQLELEGENFACRRRYAEFVESCGGAPVLLATTSSGEVPASALSACDGLIIAGGADVESWRYGEEPLEGCDEALHHRDDIELALVRYAYELDIPYLGICRGLHVMNVALGGTLFQRTAAHTRVKHWQSEDASIPSHIVLMHDESPVRDALCSFCVPVNSLHKQSVGRLAPHLSVAACDLHGLIEAAFAPDKRFFVGVQWHPEHMPERQESRALMRAFLAACSSETKREPV